MLPHPVNQIFCGIDGIIREALIIGSDTLSDPSYGHRSEIQPHGQYPESFIP